MIELQEGDKLRGVLGDGPRGKCIHDVFVRWGEEGRSAFVRTPQGDVVPQIIGRTVEVWRDGEWKKVLP